MVVVPAHKPPRTIGVRTTYVVFERVRMYTRIHHKNQHSNTNARTQVHKAAIELARKRVESTVDLRDRESSEMLTLLHDRCSLQWQRISDGKTERTYISGRLVATPFRIIFIATSKTVRQKRMSLYMSSSFTVSVPWLTIVNVRESTHERILVYDEYLTRASRSNTGTKRSR